MIENWRQKNQHVKEFCNSNRFDLRKLYQDHALSFKTLWNQQGTWVEHTFIRSSWLATTYKEEFTYNTK